jgi:hypothetical protein
MLFDHAQHQGRAHRALKARFVPDTSMQAGGLDPTDIPTPPTDPDAPITSVIVVTVARSSPLFFLFSFISHLICLAYSIQLHQ